MTWLFPSWHAIGAMERFEREKSVLLSEVATWIEE